MRRRILLLTLSLLAANARAVPAIDGIFPLGGQRGTSVTVKAEGKFDTWPPGLWADAPGLHLTPVKEAGFFTIQIDKDVAVGPHLFRLYTPDGAAPGRVFFVTDEPEIREVEPNDDPRAAQSIAALPATINGQLEKSEDVDHYSVHLNAGQRLVASLQGRRLGSPIDPMLHLLDADSNELAFAHDGLGLDPLLSYQVTRSATYIVRVSAFAYPPASDVRLAGGKGDYYRLHLTTGPYARFLRPSGVQRGAIANLQLVGWGIPSSASVNVDASKLVPFEDHMFIPCPGEGRLRVEVGEGRELSDVEARRSGAVLTAPVSITGCLSAVGEEHRFQLAVKKGESIHAAIRAAGMNSPVDPMLRVFGPAGGELAKVNGEATDFQAPADGTCTVIFADLFHKGGDDYFYRLTLSHPSPLARATIDTHAYALLPGKSATIKANVSRQAGHKTGLLLVATDLPAGVTSTSAAISEKGGDATITLTAAPDAKTANAPFHVMLLGTDPSHPESIPARYVRQEAEGAAEFLPQADPWLTVLVPAATAPATKPAKP